MRRLRNATRKLASTALVGRGAEAPRRVPSGAPGQDAGTRRARWPHRRARYTVARLPAVAYVLGLACGGRTVIETPESAIGLHQIACEYV